ncbi:MAG: thioredoxin domain-containing protein, partial [Pleurocapsa sp.]
ASANSVRMASVPVIFDYRDRAEQGLNAFGIVMENSPTACPSLFTALDWVLHGTSVKTDRNNIEQLSYQYLPTTVFRLETDLPEDSIALVCQGLSCLEPATSLEQVIEQIDRS